MSKLIKLSDSVGYSLSKRAEEDGLSMAAEVAKLLAVSETPPHPTDLNYFDKKFAHLEERLEELITDNLVDVVDSGRAPRSSHTPGSKEWVYWDQMQYIIFTHDDDDPAWLVPEGAVFQFKNGDPTSYSYYVKDDTIYMENGGRPTPLIKVTPEVQKAIDEKLTYD